MTGDTRTRGGRSWLLLIVGGLALFALTGLAGFRWSRTNAAVGPETVVPVYGGEVVTQPSEEQWRAQAETVVHDETVRAIASVTDQSRLKELGIVQPPDARPSGSDGASFVSTDVAAEVPAEGTGGSSGGGASGDVSGGGTGDTAGGGSTGTTGGGSSDTLGGSSDGAGGTTVDTSVPGEDEPAPIPRLVIDNGFLANFVDMAQVPFAPVPNDFRFDICAGAVPFAETPAGCPSGSGATIMPLDDPIERAYYSIDWFNDAACVTDTDTVRLALRATRPSVVHVSAWNYRGAESLGIQPDRAPDQTVTVASTSQEIDQWLSTDPATVFFCVELHGLEHGVIHVSFDGASALPLESDLIDGGTRDIPFYAAGLDRPPTTANPLTASQIYVTTYRRSVDNQQTFVQARIYGEQSCDNGGDMSLITSNPGAIQSVLDTTLELKTYIAGWPWDPQWDRADLHRLRLDSGRLYLLCAYWVESDGPTFEPDRVVRTEAMLAVAPDLSTMTVSLDNIQFVDLGDDPRINIVSVIPTQFGVYGCRGESVDVNSSTHDAYFLGPDLLCRVTSPGRELERGGFSVQTRAIDSLGNTYARSVFIHVDPDELFCHLPCDPVVRHVSIPLPYVPKRAISGSAEWPGTFETGAIPPDGAGEEGLPAGSVGLILRFDPTGNNWWGLDTFREVAQMPADLPERPRFDLNVTTNSNSDTLSGQAAFELVADREVSVAASVTGSGGSAPCTTNADGVVPDYSSTGLATRHTFSFTGLCVATQYEIHVTALDASGTAGQVTSRPSSGDVQVIPFGTPGVDVTVRADFVVLSAPASSGGNVFHVRHSPQFEIDSLIPGYRSATPGILPATASGSVVTNPNVEAGDVGWTFNVPYDDIMCVADPSTTPSASYARRARPSQRNWSVQTSTDGIRFHFQVDYGMAPRLYVGEGSTTSSTLCTSSFAATGTFTIDETVTLDQLHEGIEFLSDDGRFLVRLSD